MAVDDRDKVAATLTKYLAEKYLGEILRGERDPESVREFFEQPDLTPDGCYAAWAIYEACWQSSRRGKVGIVTVANFLLHNGELSNVGGIAELLRLQDLPSLQETMARQEA